MFSIEFGFDTQGLDFVSCVSKKIGGIKNGEKQKAL